MCWSWNWTDYYSIRYYPLNYCLMIGCRLFHFHRVICSQIVNGCATGDGASFCDESDAMSGDDDAMNHHYIHASSTQHELIMGGINIR